MDSMRIRFRVREASILGCYAPGPVRIVGGVLVAGFPDGLKAVVEFHMGEGDFCRTPKPLMVFESSSRRFAEHVANELVGLVAVPLDEMYVSGIEDSDYMGFYRFAALPPDLAADLASGAAVPVEEPEFERAASLMADRGIAKLEGGCIRLTDESIAKSIVRQLERVWRREKAVLEGVRGG